MQRCCQIPEPLWINGYVVIHKCQNIRVGLPNPRVEGVRLALPGLKQVPEPSRVLPAKVRDHFPCLVGRVVVHDKYLPLVRLGEL